ncbi:MAG: response regulator transcription factor [Elusimicrobia bacterium]|nr:response regulator transcription factor [Elusimicrobiota bacterium]
MNESAPLIVVVDDDPSVRTGLCRLLRSAGRRVQSFISAEEFMASDSLFQACCLLLDLRLPGLTGTELQKELKRRGLTTPIVFITGHGDIATGVQAMKDGAVDFLQKPIDDKDLLLAVDRALERDRHRKSVDQKKTVIQGRLATLTPAENAALRWMITGQLNKQIARNLGVKEKTIRVHRGRVLHKMDARSVAELVLMAHTVNINPPEDPKE